MLPNYYLDIKAITLDNETPVYAVLAKAVHVLHGAFSKPENLGKFAICFPMSRQGVKNRSTGDVIRVFASTSMELLVLLDSLKGHHVLRDYTSYNLPKQVPEDFSGTWSVWRRVRVQKKEGINREKTIERASASIFVDMRSSTGKIFPLRVFRESSQKQVNEILPNSYGLASSDNLFALPDID
jgi:hypothetical protein